MTKSLLLAALLGMVCAASAQADTASDPIKIGGIFSYTGIPSYMIRAQNAAQMAVDEQNAQGGIRGRKIDLIIRDDKYRPDEASRLTEELITRDKVTVLMGQSSTSLALAIANVARQEKVPYFAAWCWEDSCVQAGKDVIFTLDQNPADTLAPIVQHTASVPVKRWALLGGMRE